jgi:hypothetical protein
VTVVAGDAVMGGSRRIISSHGSTVVVIFLFLIIM